MWDCETLKFTVLQEKKVAEKQEMVPKGKQLWHNIQLTNGITSHQKKGDTLWERGLLAVSTWPVFGW